MRPSNGFYWAVIDGRWEPIEVTDDGVRILDRGPRLPHGLVTTFSQAIQPPGTSVHPDGS